MFVIIAVTVLPLPQHWSGVAVVLQTETPLPRHLVSGLRLMRFSPLYPRFYLWGGWDLGAKYVAHL